MDGGAWWATVHGVTKGRTRLSDFTFTFHFHALEKEMATHSSVPAWRIPGTGEPDGLPSMGSHRVGHDWSDLAAAAAAAAAPPGKPKPHCKLQVKYYQYYTKKKTCVSWLLCNYAIITCFVSGNSEAHWPNATKDTSIVIQCQVYLAWCSKGEHSTGQPWDFLNLRK